MSNAKPLPFKGGVGVGQSLSSGDKSQYESVPHPNRVGPVLVRPGGGLGRTPEGEGL